MKLQQEVDESLSGFVGAGVVTGTSYVLRLKTDQMPQTHARNYVRLLRYSAEAEALPTTSSVAGSTVPLAGFKSSLSATL